MTNTSLTDAVVQLREIKTEITALTATLNRFKSSQAAIENQILNDLDALGNNTTSISTKAGTVSILESIVPHVKDWSLVHEYVRKHGAFHLLHRRMSAPAFRELLEMEEDVPGTEALTKRTIGLTKAKTP